MYLNRVKNILIENWVMVLSLVLCAWVLIPLLHLGFFSMHDNEQVARLFDLDKALRAGQFPVRILPNLGFGYGYPLFNFYPPFVYYFAEIFKLLGFGYIDSIKLMIAAGFLFSYVFMYLLVKELFGKMAGVLAATLYIFAPYHSVDVYVRGALPEFWSFVFVPAIFWSMLRLQRTGKRIYIVYSSIFGAGLVLTHNLVAVMLVPFIAIYFLYLIYISKNRVNLALQTLLSFIIGASVSAFFWLPSFLEKGYTAVNILTIELADYSQHFVCARQFLFSRWGYSGSVPGCLDGLSFNLGLPQIVFLGLLLFLLAINFKKTKKYFINVLFLLMFIISLFVQTIHSKFIWDNLPFLSYIQFPWRFLLISSFTISFLAGAVLSFDLRPRIKIAICVIGLATVFILNKDFFKPQEYFAKARDYAYTSREVIRWDTSSLAAEYVPKGVSMKKTKFGNTAINITKEEIAKNSYKVMSGNMVVSVVTDNPQRKSFNVVAYQSGVFQPQTFSFPGWRVFVDGKEVNYSDNNKFKLITFGLEKGKHSVEMQFSDTPIRKLANVASLIGIIGLFALVFGSNPLKYLLKRRK